MCFSAGASFGASAVLLGAGIGAIKRIESPKMLPFACTPIIFSLHQLSEGILWLTFKNPEMISWYKPCIYSYTLISQVIWPIWIPFVVWIMEPDKVKKKMISYFVLLGGASAAYLLYCLVAYGVSAEMESCHIRYTLHFPTMNLRRVLYLLTTMVPIFLSSLRYMKLLGGTMLGSLILSFIFYTNYVISVWCFFAAILSALIHLVITYNKKPIISSLPG